MFGAIFGAISKFAATAIGKAVVGGAVSAIANNIGRKTTAPKIDLVGMRKDAEKAGFNPLSVMRYGGMGGYMLPAMSSQTFAAEFLGNVMTSGFDAWANQDIDKYNAQIRELELQQRRADLSYTKGLTGQIAKQQFSGLDQPQTMPLMESDGNLVRDADGNVIYVPAENFESIPKYKLVYDQATGALYPIINPELTESGLSETITGLAMDAAGQTAARTGTGLSWQGYGFAADPFGLNRGFRSVGGNNMTYARPALSFAQ